MTDDIHLSAIEGHDDALAVRPGGEVTDAERMRSDLDALKEGAAMLTQVGNRVAALALLWSAVAIDPTDLGARRRLAAMLAKRGDVDGAANAYARYIEFMLPVGDVARATVELARGAKVRCGRPALHEAAEKIVTAVRALVPAGSPTGSLPTPRLLPKVAFRFCVHDDGVRHWMQLEGGTSELVPTAVRLIDRQDNVVETRTCIPLAPGQKGHARIIEGEPSAGVAWAVLGISDEVVAALDAGKPSYRVQTKIGEEWVSSVLVDTGCRLGRRPAKIAVS